MVGSVLECGPIGSGQPDHSAVGERWLPHLGLIRDASKDVPVVCASWQASVQWRRHPIDLSPIAGRSDGRLDLTTSSRCQTPLPEPRTASWREQLHLAHSAGVRRLRSLRWRARRIIPSPRHLALCRAMLAKRPAGAAFGNVQNVPVNRSGFLGGCLCWVRRPRLCRRRGHDSALRPRREGSCRSARAGGGGCTSRPTPGWRTRPPRRSATGHASGSPPP